MIVCQFPPVFLIMVMSVSKFGYETTSQDTSGLLTDSVSIFQYSIILRLGTMYPRNRWYYRS